MTEYVTASFEDANKHLADFIEISIKLVRRLHDDNEKLKGLLRQSTDWNWIDFDEDCEDPARLEESKVTEPSLWKLHEEIKEALK